jgi:hypothetical protein
MFPEKLRYIVPQKLTEVLKMLTVSIMRIVDAMMEVLSTSETSVN